MRSALVFAIAGCSFAPPGQAVPRDGASAGDTSTIDADLIDASTLSDGLIAWYQMESIAGSSAADATGHGHDGACGLCPTVVAGHTGSGFSFDGTTRVDVSDAGAFDTGAFTVAMWVEYTDLDYSTYECPTGKVLDSTIYNSWELCYHDDGKWLYDTVPPSSTGYQFAALEGSSGPSVGVWYHTAMVWDGSTKSLYIDGALAATASNVQVAFGSGMPLSFGADIDYGGQSSEFVGVLDDLRIYGRALGSAELAALAAE